MSEHRYAKGVTTLHKIINLDKRLPYLNIMNNTRVKFSKVLMSFSILRRCGYIVEVLTPGGGRERERTEFNIHMISVVSIIYTQSYIHVLYCIKYNTCTCICRNMKKLLVVQKTN